MIEQDKGLKLPKRLADESSRELNAADIWGAFATAYRLEGPQRFNLGVYDETSAQWRPRVRGRGRGK